MSENRNRLKGKATALLLISLLAFTAPYVVAGEEPDKPDALPDAAEITPQRATTDREDAYDNMELLTQVILLIRKHYYQVKEFSEITEGALHGLLKGLDEHSDFLDTSAYTDMKDDTSGKFGGIGIHIGVRDGLLTVIAPIEDTPAFRAGLQAGDRITAINGTNTVGKTLRSAIRQLRGPKGAAVSVTLRRAAEEAPITVEIVRDEISVPSIKGVRILSHGVGYIRLTRFAKPTADSLDEAIVELENQEMEALILDLRNNAGGLLKSAIEIADRFLDKGQEIVSTKGRTGIKGKVSYSASQDKATDVPMVVLVNVGSASASEIVAGALQDHKRAIIIGDTTYGKGSVQSVIRLKPEGKSAIRLTTALYYTPSDRQIHNKGLDPDIPVYVEPKEWQRVQIRRAHLENPKLYAAEEMAEYDDVTDRALRRAVDLLQAVKVFEK